MRTSRPARRTARILALLTTIALLMAMMPVTVSAIPVEGTTWYVDASATTEGTGTIDDPFRSLTSALGAALSGDQIEVAPGTYGQYEVFPLNIIWNDLVIYSTGGPEETIIDGDGVPTTIFMVTESVLDLSGFTITGATGTDMAPARVGGGGGMTIIASDVVLSDMVITGNVAYRGAGLYVGDGSQVVMIESTITRNGAFPPDIALQIDPPTESGTIAGGGVAVDYSVFLAIQSEISENKAGMSGAGIEASGSGILCQESVIRDNVLSGGMVPNEVSGWSAGDASVAQDLPMIDGAGVFGYDTLMLLYGSTFSGNVGMYGAVGAVASQIQMEECEITGHEGFAAMGYLAAPWNSPLGTQDLAPTHDQTAPDMLSADDLLAMSPGDSASVAMTFVDQQRVDLLDTVFTGNTGETVFFGEGGWTWMENCAFYGNDIMFPTIGLENVFGDIDYCTLYDNGSTWGVWSGGLDADVYVVGSIVWDALGDDAPIDAVEMTPSIFWDGSLGLFYNDLKSPAVSMAPDSMVPSSLVADVGSIYEEPRLMDPDNGDLRLALGSPCVDAGFMDYYPQYDLASNERPVDGDGDGSAAPDIGALEYVHGGRLGGEDRYGTAIQAVEQNFDFADTVVIGTGECFADALSASALCGAYEAPLLLTKPDELTQEVADEIVRLGASQAIIVGGPAAVYPAVEAALVDMGLGVTRIGGLDRYETSALIAEHVIEVTDFDGRVFLTRGDAFADALAVSPIAYANVTPVLLVRSDRLPSAVVEFMYDYGVGSAAILGGDGAVSTLVEAGVQLSLGVTTERIGGVDRYETAALISEWAYDNGMAQFSMVGIATGTNFPDALCGGPALGVRNGVLLLTPPTELCTPAGDSLSGHAPEVADVQFFGGTGAISDDVVFEVYNVLGSMMP